MKKPTRPYLTVKDHSVSKKTFELHYDQALDMLYTHPQPDENELSKYYQSEDYISHTDTKRNFFEWVYQWVRTITLKRKVKLINSFDTSSKRLLDIGCGTGDFLKQAQKAKWEVIGIEPNEQARSVANEKVGKKVFSEKELENLDKASFDVITLWHVLEHLPNLEEKILQIKTLLKPKGILIIAVPNFKSYDATHYYSFWAAYDVPRHLWHFSRTSILKLFQPIGFELVKTLPMKFDAYYVSLLSEKYKSGFMNPFKAFWIGFKSNLKARTTKEYSSLIYVLRKN